MAADCEKPIPHGGKCDIPAIGRCAFCGEAFCLTHQAREEFPVPKVFVDWCSVCQAESIAAQIAEKRAANVRAATETHSDETAARLSRLKKLLIESNRIQWEDRRVRTGYRRSFGISRPTWESLDPAIPIGDLEWEFPLRGDFVADTVTSTHESGLTAASRIVLMSNGVYGEKFHGEGALHSRPTAVADRLEDIARRAGIAI